MGLGSKIGKMAVEHYRAVFHHIYCFGYKWVMVIIVINIGEWVMYHVWLEVGFTYDNVSENFIPDFQIILKL